jgi:AcrR family transcriptional regulator
MSSRHYRSLVRAENSGRTRARIIKAAAAMLATGSFSLDGVAKKARVTRLTVYHQFGSRRALLEAVFDDMAERSGVDRIRDAMANPDAHEALQMVVRIFCDFWKQAPPALWRLHAASAGYAELAESLRQRNERRRQLFSVLVRRLADNKEIPAAVTNDLADTLFALTSLSFYSELATGGQSADAVCQLIQGLVTDVARRTLAGNEQKRSPCLRDKP